MGPYFGEDKQWNTERKKGLAILQRRKRDLVIRGQRTVLKIRNSGILEKGNNEKMKRGMMEEWKSYKI
jgi:hypothetical protein